MQPMTKPMINFFWKQQPFRLNLKGYQGNCITCFKKSDKKLFQIAKENPEAFNFFDKIETTYNNKHKIFRNNRTTKQILQESKYFNGKIKNDSDIYNYQLDLFENESCEVFSECGQ
jgi:hypothetical protein